MRFLVTSRSAVCPSTAPITAISRRSESVRLALGDAHDARRTQRQRRSRMTNQTPRPRPRRLAPSTMRRIAKGIERFILEPLVP